VTLLDPRLNAVRPDLADARLEGRASSQRFVSGALRQVNSPVLAVHQEPRFDSMQVTQLLSGERVRVFDTHEGWAWMQAERDSYVGYVPADDLSDAPVEPTHRVAVPTTLLFPGPDIKSQPVIMVTMNAQLAVESIDERFARLRSGRYAIAGHLKSVAKHETDFVASAEALLHTPYLWGGKSALGIDCSGLVQLALESAGVACPRDSDMQEEALGRPLGHNERKTLGRGDLVFWQGHVGIMRDEVTLLHANAHFMQVTSEPFAEAEARIAARYGAVTAIKRLQ
jgi:cell wall-associated NlpC family hydrolase